MGTRSNTIVIDAGEQVLNLYRQHDGSPEWHGSELAEFLNGIKMVNGLGLTTKGRVANGAGCLAAQMVAHFKLEPGGFYIHPPCEPSECGNDYTYVIDVSTMEPEKGITVTVYEFGNDVFVGNVDGFIAFTQA